MNKFKGTPGNWENKSDEVWSGERKVAETISREYNTYYNTEKEAKANALIISKAPKLLQQINYLFEKLQNGNISIYNSDGGNISDAYKKEYERLIKEATEI